MRQGIKNNLFTLAYPTFEHWQVSMVNRLSHIFADLHGSTFI